MDHESRPEMQNGTVDFLVPRIYWAPQPPPTGSLIDTAIDNTSDAITSTASDLLSGLQSSLGQEKSRASTPQPNAREREKERKKEEKRLRKPQGLGRVFVIDVSSGSVGRGILSEICEGIRRAVYGDKKQAEDGDDAEEEDVGLGKGERIAIMTVAESIGFWNLSVSAMRRSKADPEGGLRRSISHGRLRLRGHVCPTCGWVPGGSCRF